MGLWNDMILRIFAPLRLCVSYLEIINAFISD
jgi:hypothetical protein